MEEPMKHSLNQIVNIVDEKQRFDDLSVSGEAFESHSSEVSPYKKVYRIDDKVCNSEPNYCFSFDLRPVFSLPRHGKTRIHFVFLI